MYSHPPAPPPHPSRADETPVEPQQKPVLPITIAVMGATGSGKTSFINSASGSHLRVGTHLKSCTAEVQLADEFTLDGQQIVLIDTPGFDDTNRSDTEILKLIAAFLATAYEADLKLAGIVYIHRISDKRFTGNSRRNFQMFRELCGDTSLKNVVLVTNMWGEVSQDVGEARELELITDFFKTVLDKGAQLARHHNTVKSAHDIIRSIMKNRPMALQIQRELIDEKKDIIDTAAGEAVNKELNEHIRRHQADLKEVRNEMQALKDKDGEAMKELEEETRKLKAQMDKMSSDSAGMTSSYLDEKKRMGEAMRQMQEQFRQEGEMALLAYKQQMEDFNKRLQERADAEREMIQDLNRRLQERIDVSAAEREAMQNQIKHLQHQWDTRPHEGGGCLIM